MKVLILIATLISLNIKVECQNNVIYDLSMARELFKQYKQDFGKRYCSTSDRKYRYKLFVENLQAINSVNSDPNNKYQAKLTQFADLTAEEVQRCCLGPNPDDEVLNETDTPTDAAEDNVALKKQTGDDLSSRIMYGATASIKDHAYFAYLGHCGAAIISSRWLVTAAHCVQYPSLLKGVVWVGGEHFKNSKQYAYDSIISHPDFKAVSRSKMPINDIALIKLKKDLKFSDSVKALKLPKQKYKLNTKFAFAGKGVDEKGKPSYYLMKTNLRTLDLNECLSVWEKAVAHGFLNEIEKVTICTKRTDGKPGLCFGDSGSALVQDNTLVGIASFINALRCQSTNIALFTNVLPFVDWIKSHTGIDKDQTSPKKATTKKQDRLMDRTPEIYPKYIFTTS